jgi:cellulose synthase/poly-beta-1,6-N-acetylglucosamine synthase-like glycosyltransferase
MRTSAAHLGERPAARPFCVCVPARNEEERLPLLLDALAGQSVAGPIPVAICLNNTSDGTAGAVAAAMRRHGSRLAVVLDIREFSPELAHAGSARRAAMALGLSYLGEEEGVLITTDADARPPADWIAANLAAVSHGDEIVGGRLVLDVEEGIPPAVAEARAQWDRYWSAVRAIEDAIDPVPWDPPPRHGDHTGGSLAIPSVLYRRAGGVPLLPSGEDQALVEAAVMAGGRLVHPLSVWTRVSARTEGRAAFGMAETMRRFAVAADDGPALTVPDLEHWRQRARWRRAMRRSLGDAGRIMAAERALPPMPLDAKLATLGLPA